MDPWSLIFQLDYETDAASRIREARHDVLKQEKQALHFQRLMFMPILDPIVGDKEILELP
jgi:hypothetical protein